MLSISEVRVLLLKSKEEAEKELNSLEEKKEIVLPFIGKKREMCCNGLEVNNGLYTQCKKEKENDKEFCKKCLKNRKYGTIDERMRVGLMEYKDPNGKVPIHYTKIMKKLNISEEEVLKEAEKLGIVIPEEHLKSPEKKKGGRPKKLITDTDNEIIKKKQGRPKISKNIISTNDDDDNDDIFSSLINKAIISQNETENSKSSEPV